MLHKLSPLAATALAGDVTALAGDVTALAGDVTALAGDVTAGGGDVTALAGALVAGAAAPGTPAFGGMVAGDAAIERDTWLLDMLFLTIVMVAPAPTRISAVAAMTVLLEIRRPDMGREDGRLGEGVVT
jgi:hypothetical protein